MKQIRRMVTGRRGGGKEDGKVEAWRFDAS